LQRLAWWDWDHDRLRAALPDFRRLSIEAFLEKYEPMSAEKPKRYPSQAPRSKTRQSKYRPEQTARSEGGSIMRMRIEGGGALVGGSLEGTRVDLEFGAALVTDTRTQARATQHSAA